MNSEDFINYIKNSRWFYNEESRNTIINEFIEKLNLENTIGKIILENSPYDQISSIEKISSTDYDAFYQDKNSFNYFSPPNNEEYYNEIEESSTGISNYETNNENQFIFIVNEIFENFIKIKDNDNMDNTVLKRKDAFKKFMELVNKKYRQSNK